MNIEPIAVEQLLEKVQALRKQGMRLVQISATRLPEAVELTYSFDLEGRLTNLRLTLPGARPHVPSISGIYPCAFHYGNEIHDLFGVQVEGLTADFKGNFYKTAVPFPFSNIPAPSTKPVS